MGKKTVAPVPTHETTSVADLLLIDPVAPVATVTTTGWLQGRRRFQNAVTLLDLVDTYSYSLAAKSGGETNTGASSHNEDTARPNWSDRLLVSRSHSTTTTTTATTTTTTVRHASRRFFQRQRSGR